MKRIQKFVENLLREITRELVLSQEEHDALAQALQTLATPD